MQTFLPYADYERSVACIDNKRLQKQAVETYQILLNLLELRPIRDEQKTTIGFERVPPRFNNDGSMRAAGWGNHPMTRMWRGYEMALCRYQVATCAELLRRPTKTGKPRSIKVLPLTAWALYQGAKEGRLYNPDEPHWLGRGDVHSSHRGRLKDKDAVWYGQFGWAESPIPESVGYVWPVD